MPKRRNFVKKNMDKLHRPQTHRDRTKYDRYEDYLKDQLDDYLDSESDDLDEDEKQRREEFKAKLAGTKYDPDMREEWEEYLMQQALEYDEAKNYLDYDYDDYGDFDDCCF